MSYLVLARKFRPQTFASVVGQDHITKAIANAIVRGRVPHAFLFTGPRGVGKTTTARLVARALNCTGRTVPPEAEIPPSVDTRTLIEPCGTCTNCVEIARGSSMAVREIDGASNNSVENVRDLIESLRSLPPPNTQYKIYIVDEVHMLSVAAFNALLKSLEEPPPNTIFVFATTEPHKIPETVISRCQRHDFLRIPLEIIVEQLRLISVEEKIAADDAVFAFVARRAQGGMRDAQSMFDRLIAFSDGTIRITDAQRLFSVLDDAFCLRLSKAVLEQSPNDCFNLIDHVFQQSIDVRAFVQDFLCHWRNLLLIAVDRDAAPGSPREAVLLKALEMTAQQLVQFREQIADRPVFDFQRLFDIAEDTAQRAIASPFPRFVLEAGLTKMALLSTLKPLDEVLRRIESIAASGHSGGQPVTGQSVTGQSGTGQSGTGQLVTGQGLRQTASSDAKPQVRNDRAQAQSPAGESKTYLSTDSGTAPDSSAGFDPSWQAFIAHVRSRKELVLEAYLKRSTPKRFLSGELTIEGAQFDCTAMQDKSTLQSLKQALHGYSGVEHWDVRFIIHKDTPGSAAAPDPRSVEKRGKPAPRPQNAPVPGSLADQEAKEQTQRRKDLEQDARNDPAVQIALETFDGSAVERVSVVTPPRG